MNPDEINEVLEYSDDDIFGSDDGFSVMLNNVLTY